MINVKGISKLLKKLGFSKYNGVIVDIPEQPQSYESSGVYLLKKAGSLRLIEITTTVRVDTKIDVIAKGSSSDIMYYLKQLAGTIVHKNTPVALEEDDNGTN